MATRHRTEDSTDSDGAARHHRRYHEPRKPDAFTRLAHAVLVVAFLGAWLTAEWAGLRAWHIACGQVLVGALLLRVVWSLLRPDASLGRWWRSFVGAGRRLLSGPAARAVRAGSLRPATWSLMGLAGVVCAIVALVPACFVTGAMLDRLADAPAEPVDLHRWLGTALMVAVATHVALIAVLGMLRGRCMACDMLPGGGDGPGDSEKGRG